MITISIKPSPDFSAFSEGFEARTPQLVWIRKVVDLETPVSALLKLKEAGEPCFLLESVEGGETRGRYSIIGLKPDLIWQCRDGVSYIGHLQKQGKFEFTEHHEKGLAALRTVFKESELEIPSGLPPMAAGCIGYLGYDMVRLMEHLPAVKTDTLDIPDACFMRPQVMAIFDSVAGVVYVATTVRDFDGTAKEAYQAATKRIEIILTKLAAPLPSSLGLNDKMDEDIRFASNIKKEDFCRKVETIKEYIASGDVYQTVLSQRFEAPFNLPPISLYRSLRHLNPSPFLFYLDFGNYALVGASPEILVRLRDETVTVRPIAGTRKRGKTPQEDDALETELFHDEKERSEHLMLLDLGRNDVGRVAETGTVRVTQEMIVERYSHVMHLVSNVEGTLDKKYDMIDALAAGFPAGTVSGAPKIRAMEVIDELEDTKRSFYAGGVGYFSSNGQMDTCIALRTALVKDKKIYLQAGAGVVADSVPEAEYEECHNKAKALMQAAREAIKYEG